MEKYLKKAAAVTFTLLLICGGLIPLPVIAKVPFPRQANGSIVKADGKEVGSEVVGQEFEGDQYFHGRISSVNYNTYTKEEKESGEYTGVASGSFNYGATSEDLKARVENDVKAFKERYREATGAQFTGEIPQINATASASDPDHISPESAEVQLPIVAAKSGLSEDEVEKIVENNTEHKALGFSEKKK